jgi:hypothetical protein
MNERNIKIDRLEIRLKGVGAEVARAAADDLGHEVLGQLAAQQVGLSGRRSVHIGEIDSGSFRQPGQMNSAELRSFIARKVAASIISQLK